MASLSSKRSLLRYEIMQETQQLTNAGVDISSTDSIIYQLVFANITGGAVTVTVTDKQSTPLDLYKTVSIAANSTTVVNFQEGVFMKGGITWNASANTSINAQIFGLKK